MRLYWDNGKENGNYYLGFGTWGLWVRMTVEGLRLN